MGKIFLSHSSKDKEFVRPIATFFGKDRCFFDEMCFEVGMKNIDEIFRCIDSTSIFVIFISNNSLESDWVKRELHIAYDKLNLSESQLDQIFPIIIDEGVKYNDPRIPDFLKKGLSSYNLRYISNSKIACKKIQTQYVKRTLDKSLVLQNKFKNFYGRGKEIKEFKDAFDSGQGIKCVICTGIQGIGRKSYLTECLRESQIIEKYYEPSLISLSQFDTIDDLIVKLSEIGFGEYSLDKVLTLKTIEEKIIVLTEIFQIIQNHNENVIIYDELCLVNYSGEVIYWFDKALNGIRDEVTISIAAKANISFSFFKKNLKYFHISLSTLTYPEWNGLMRTYAKTLGFEIDTEDREYFRGIITGYPPQVKISVEQIKEYGINYMKSNSHLITTTISDGVLKLLDNTFDSDMKNESYELLSFLSAYGIIPSNILAEILKLNIKYTYILVRMKAVTICRTLGSFQEYVEVNPVVADYIQRSGHPLTDELKKYLNKKVEDFNKNINHADYEDFENIKFYLKENIINKTAIPEKFLYSTIYLQSIYELYNKQKYRQVIEIAEALKTNGSFERYDEPIKFKLQWFYCLSLAREIEDKFYNEVEWFKSKNMDEDTLVDYNFLRGFMFRQNCEYGKALERYRKVLQIRPKHKGAMREIVIVYRGLEDYESSRFYAELNYRRDKDNPFNILPYFDSIIRSALNDEQKRNDIKKILETIQLIHNAKPLIAYYEIMSKYEQYFNTNKEKTIDYLKEGLRVFSDSSYLAKALFDCYKAFEDLDGMKLSINILRNNSIDNKSATVALRIREAILNAYIGKPKLGIYSQIDAINGLTVEAKNKLKNEVDVVLLNYSKSLS